MRPAVLVSALLVLLLVIAGCAAEPSEEADSVDAESAESSEDVTDAAMTGGEGVADDASEEGTEPATDATDDDEDAEGDGEDPAGDQPLHARPGTELPPEPDLTDAVVLAVGDDLQTAIDAQPAGTTFLLAAGEHRGQSLLLRDGDTLVGEPGAVLNGAVVLDDFEPDGDVWVSSGHTQEPDTHGVMLEGWDNEANPHDLFRDGQHLRHALTRDEVGPGTYFFDYEADEVVMGDDPAGAVIELAVTPTAIAGPGTRDVTVRGIEIRHYAVRSQAAALNGSDTHDWTVVGVRAVANHAAGIRLGSGTEVHGCWVEGNGQIGVIGGLQEEADRPMLVRGCVIAGNATLGYDWTWEAGATKFFDTDGLVFDNNEVRDNDGPGLWFDTMNTDAVITNNTIAGNAINGVFYELSSGALIEGNTITDNGADGGALAAGIFIANSPGVTIRDNVLSGNANEIVGVQSHHGDEIDIPRLVEDFLVEDNQITLTDGFVGLSVTTDQEFLYTDGNNRFLGNDYVLDGCDPCFLWGDGVSLEEWQALGHDLDGTVESR